MAGSADDAAARRQLTADPAGDSHPSVASSAVPAELVPGVTVVDVEQALRARPDLIDDLMRSLGDLIREATVRGRL